MYIEYLAMKKIILSISVLIFLTGCQAVTKPPVADDAYINSFEDCIAAGYPAMESYPRQCRTADGKHFVEVIDLPVGAPDSPSLEANCKDAGGNWLGEFNECEYVSREWCDEKGGQFKECESACRHNPEAEFCTLQCVIVCQF